MTGPHSLGSGIDRACSGAWGWAESCRSLLPPPELCESLKFRPHGQKGTRGESGYRLCLGWGRNIGGAGEWNRSKLLPRGERGFPAGDSEGTGAAQKGHREDSWGSGQGAGFRLGFPVLPPHLENRAQMAVSNWRGPCVCPVSASTCPMLLKACVPSSVWTDQVLLSTGSSLGTSLHGRPQSRLCHVHEPSGL